MVPTIDIRSLHYQYFEGTPSVLTDINLHVPSGSCAALLGPAGAGKTTLLQVLSGVVGSQFTTGKADGRILIGDQEFLPIPSRVLFPEVGYLMQDASVQLSGIKETVAEELAFSLDNLGITGDERSRRVSAALSEFDLAHLAHRAPSRLSGGELQRVALASLLVSNPSLLLLDEPISALDSMAQQRMVSFIRSAKRTATVLLSDSGIDFALAVADLFVVMDGGRILFTGNRNQFLNSLQSFSHLLPISLWDEVLSQSRRMTVDSRITRIFT